jgi:hypothetical protein
MILNRERGQKKATIAKSVRSIECSDSIRSRDRNDDVKFRSSEVVFCAGDKFSGMS